MINDFGWFLALAFVMAVIFSAGAMIGFCFACDLNDMKKRSRREG